MARWHVRLLFFRNHTTSLDEIPCFTPPAERAMLGLPLTATPLDGDAGGGSPAVIKHCGVERECMPVDPTNMPFQRTGIREATEDLSELAGGRQYDTTLKLESMLMEEFNYASVTAYQALEDRARMFNLYLLLIGVVASAVGAIYQIGKPDAPSGRGLQYLMIVLLGAGAMLGAIFFAKLIRLRQAWRESALAMNTVKEFYIHKFKAHMPDVEHAFRWRLHTMPKGERLGSVTFLVCYTTAFLGSLCLAGATYEAYNAFFSHALDGVLSLNSNKQAPAVAGFAALIWVVLHVIYYVRALSKRKDKAAIEAAEAEVDGPGKPALR